MSKNQRHEEGDQLMTAEVRDWRTKMVFGQLQSGVVSDRRSPETVSRTVVTLALKYGIGRDELSGMLDDVRQQSVLPFFDVPWECGRERMVRLEALSAELKQSGAL